MQEEGSRARQVMMPQKCTCQHLKDPRDRIRHLAESSAMVVGVQNTEAYTKMLR